MEIHRLTRCHPTDKRYGLTADIRKTSRSIPYNIAQGHKRGRTTEYIRFRGIAGGSTRELGTQLLPAHRSGYHEGNIAERAFALHAEVEGMTDSLVRKSLL